MGELAINNDHWHGVKEGENVISFYKAVFRGLHKKIENGIENVRKKLKK